ncbi:uncharacterized protein LOC112692456 [Sipha flava]|uniref:Uncharacterized protein LOC112692456 n=3 Tax=Sipha flava TaxID=143950 RepID=A0A8B8GK01_9HEMI|nr:uncharacterized protein LOC112692456 [Sipha flava]
MSHVPGFTHEEDIILIDFVKTHSVLYDRSHERHKDHAFKEPLWCEISTELDKSVNQCKKRWKTIKTAYLKNRIMETGSINKSDTTQLLSLRLSFLDLDQLQPSSSIANNRNEGEEILNYMSLINPPNYEEDSNPSREEKIIMLRALSKGLKELNEMLFKCFLKQIEILNNTINSTKFDENNVSNSDNNETTDEHVANDDDDDEENYLLPTRMNTDGSFSYSSENVAESKEKNTVLQNLQKEFELLYNKSETTQSLGLFFKSVLKDIECVAPRGLNDLKPRIIKCVSDVREMYLYSDVSLGSVPCKLPKKSAKSGEGNKHEDVSLGSVPCKLPKKSAKSGEGNKHEDVSLGSVPCKLPKKSAKSGEGNKHEGVSLGSVPYKLPKKSAKSGEGNKHLSNLKKKFDLLNYAFETTTSMELFFLSVIADIEDFSVHAIDDVKLRILECVSEVKDMYSNQDVSSIISSPNATPRNLQPRSSPRDHLNTLESPPQGYLVYEYYNVPVYSDEPSNYIQPLF